MAAIDFPDNPTIGDVVTAGARTWIWDGTVWDAATPTARPGGPDIDGGYWGGYVQTAGLEEMLDDPGTSGGGVVIETGTRFTFIVTETLAGEIWTRNATPSGDGGPYWERETITIPDNVGAEISLKYPSVDHWFSMRIVDRSPDADTLLIALVREHSKPEDEFVEELINDPGSLTRSSLDALYAGGSGPSATGYGHGYGLAWPSTIKTVPVDMPHIVDAGSGSWDESSIREPGQVIYDPVTEQWITVWTGKEAAFPYHSSVGMALSLDGVSWTLAENNPILPHFNPHPTEWGTDLNNEDPYIAKALDGTVWRNSDGRALIYCEEKQGANHFGVTVWQSAPDSLDPDGWEYVGTALQGGDGGGTYTNDRSVGDWDYTDRPSPVVFHDGDRLVMLYEGRYIPSSAELPEWETGTAYAVGDIVWVDGPPALTFYKCIFAHTSTSLTPDTLPEIWEVYVGQLGQVGLAFSDDEGLTFAPQPEPLIAHPTGVWHESSLVVDDVIHVDGKWVLVCHGTADESNYYIGRWVTTDAPADWGPDSFTEMVGNPFSSTSTLMCWANDPTLAVEYGGEGPDSYVRKVRVVPVGIVTDEEMYGELEALGELNGRIDTLDDDVGTISSGLSAVNGAVDSLATSVTNIDSAVNGVAATVSGLASTVSDIQAADEDMAINQARAVLAVGRVAPSTPLTSFSATTALIGGTEPIGGGTIPIHLETPALPWVNLGSELTALVESPPSPPTSDHRLVGIKVRLTCDVSELVDISPMVLFGGPFSVLVGSLGAWRNDGGPGAQLDITHTDAGAEQDVVVLLDEPLDETQISSVFVLVGWMVTGGSPSIGAGASIDITVPPEWLWDTDIIPEAGSGTVTGPSTSTAGNIAVFADENGTALDDGGTLGTAATADTSDFASATHDHDGVYAELVDGVVQSSQLPQYVDRVVEVANAAMLPTVGATSVIYVTLDTNITYRWTGTVYVEISASLALGETSSTAYRGDRGKTAYDHSQATGNPHGTTAAQISGLGTAATRNVGTGSNDVMAGNTPIPVITGKVAGGHDTGPQVINTTTETSMLDSAVAMPALADGELLNFRMAFRWFNNSGAIRNTTLRIKVGSTTVMTLLAGGLGSSSTDRIGFLDGYIRSNGTADADGGAVLTLMLSGATVSSSGTTSTGYGTLTESIQVAGLAFDITAAHAAASSSLWVQVESFAMWKVQA